MQRSYSLRRTGAHCGSPVLAGRSAGDLAFYEAIRATLALSVPLGMAAARTPL